MLVLCQQYRDYPFGNLPLRQIELVFNNWYLHSAIIQPLALAELSGTAELPGA